MKSLELVGLTFAGRLFFTSLLMLTISNGQPVADESSMDNVGAKVIYDERQSGKYNIRINIKDVAIIEMDNNDLGDEISGEEDYYYDEDYLTVKPLQLTTPSLDTNSSIFLTPIMPTSILGQSSVGPASIEEISGSKQINMSNSNTDTQGFHTASMSTTQQIIPSYRKRLFKPTESMSSLTTLEPRSNSVPISNLQPSIKVKSRPNIRSTVPSPSILMAIISSQESPKSQESREHIAAAFTVPSEKSSYSRIFKLRTQQFKKPVNFVPTKNHIRRCRTKQYDDGTGNCRSMRPASLLKKFVNVIASLPFALTRDSHND